MFGESSISFKVFVLEDGENVEIRKFEVDQGAVTNYEYIRERLQLTFPRLRGKIFKVMWKDADGDKVSISSDEEMMIALSEMKNDIFILHVYVTMDSDDDKDKPMDAFVASDPNSVKCPFMAEEEGENYVNCCHCNRTISGCRYICLECPKYHHCSECEYKEIHSEHVMIRLQKSHPTLKSLVSQFMVVVKEFLFKSPFFEQYFSRGEESKEKHHRRRYNKRCSKPSSDREHHNKSSNDCQQQSVECPYSGPLKNDIEGLITDCFGMLTNMVEKQSTDENTSTSENKPTSVNKPAAKKKAQEKKSETASAPPPENKAPEKNPTNPSTSAAGDGPIKLDENIAMALKFLTEMGYNDDGKSLSQLLQSFNGDISKTLDHIISRK